MNKLFFRIAFSLLLLSCKDKVETTFPTESPITESVYASGTIKSEKQYQAYAMATGVINQLFVNEGDIVQKGTPLLSIKNTSQELNSDNASLAAQFADFNNNKDKLEDAKQNIYTLKSKMLNDSLMLTRQRELWAQGIGSKVELEQRDLILKNSKSAYYSANIKYKDLKKQLEFSSTQSKNNLKISKTIESDFILKSDVTGIVFKLLKEKGEAVNPQIPLAIVGNNSNFILQMQVDEYDIFKIRKGQKVWITMDSYKGEVFQATVTKISPIMNEKTKTFEVEGVFTKAPKTIFPFITFEANIVIETKNNALLVPRNFLINESQLVKKNGDTITVKTGLKDYKMIEIRSGLLKTDEIQKPIQ